VLRESAVDATICRDLAALAREMAQGAGALLISEEAIAGDGECEALANQIGRQPPWSDLPIVLMTHPGADSTAVGRAVQLLGNVTLLERPVRVTALASSVRTALRAREKQYVAREHLAETARAARALQASEARLRALFATAAVGIAEVTADGHFALVNEALCRIVGIERETLMFQTVASIAHPEDKAELEQFMQGMLSGRTDSFATERTAVAARWIRVLDADHGGGGARRGGTHHARRRGDRGHRGAQGRGGGVARGRPSQGRVPRHARARAAQSARADPHVAAYLRLAASRIPRPSACAR
jgi:PAS domain S-box-containing protein